MNTLCETVSDLIGKNYVYFLVTTIRWYFKHILSFIQTSNLCGLNYT